MKSRRVLFTRHFLFFFFQAEDGIRDIGVTGVQTCALPICHRPMTFLRNRVVPPKPPSFVKLACMPSGAMAGFGSSTPTRDQVPLEMYAKFSPSAGTATTAGAGSWGGTGGTRNFPFLPISPAPPRRRG